MSFNSKNIPLLELFKSYDKSVFSSDLLAGLTLGLILIPQGIAYAIIAGLPPIFGLYSALIPPIIYAFLGTSRRLSIGAAAMDSLIIGAGLSALNYSNQLDYVSAAITVCFLAGFVQLVLGILRFGFFANFLSKPVISGFTSAASIIIAMSQLKNVFGLDIPSSNQVQKSVENLVKHLDETNWTTFIVALSTAVLLIGIKKISKLIPGPIIVVTIFTALTYFMHLDSEYGLKIVGEVPSGFPPFTGSWFLWEDLIKLAPLALTIALISYMQSISIAKSLQDMKNDHEVDNNQEMRAIGVGAMIGSLFGTYSSAGGFSRSAVNQEAGAKTPVSLIIASVFILIVLLFLTGPFYFLPKAVIGAIIITAILKLIDLKYAIELFKMSKEDFFMLLITFGVTLTVGIIEGLGIGIFVSIALLLFKSTNPHIAVCGRIPNSKNFRNINRFQDVETWENILIVRIDSNLYFANIDTVKSFIKTELLKKPQTELVVIKAESISAIDTTSLKALDEFVKSLQSQNIQVYFSGVIGPVRDLFYKIGFIDTIGKESLFLDAECAVNHFLKHENDQHQSKANQHN
ncbi:MAG: sulfate permease [Crocinitomicaceae bacterium]|nr:sulfate permease [Crocinitomicaceae bacterium]